MGSRRSTEHQFAEVIAKLAILSGQGPSSRVKQQKLVARREELLRRLCPGRHAA
jgi:hypothetical protein